MSRYLLFVLLFFLVSCIATSGQSKAERPHERPALDMERATSDLVRDEESSPTSPSNVDERYRKLMSIIMTMIQRSISAKEILPQEEGRKIESLLRSKELDKASTLVSVAIHRLPKGKAGEPMIGKEIEKNYSAFQELPPKLTGQVSNHSIDADGIFWGTEVFPKEIENVTKVVVNILKVKYIKIRLQQQMAFKDDKVFTSNICLPSQNNCRLKYNLDEIVKIFKANNWSMVPMLSPDSHGSNITTADIDSYVEFVEWFVSRYKNDANIKYMELINAPIFEWKGTKEQLLELNNRVYDRVKNRYPDILIGTPGFEYMIDAPSTDKSVQEIEYFLNKDNGARFDFWAFHGYPLTGNNFTGIYPPTKTAINNKYGGIYGILEIRKRLDANDWQDRLIVDTEHTGTILPKPTISDEEDELDAAFTIQELVLKRSLKSNGKFVLSGIMPLKIGSRGDKGLAWASLRPDGSLTNTVKAVSLLWSKLNENKYSSHVNGEFNNEDQVWIEKFISDNKELYIFFKPFKYQSGKTIKLDNQTLSYNLILNKKPTAITLTDIKGDKINLTPSQTITFEAVNSPKFLEVDY